MLRRLVFANRKRGEKSPRKTDKFLTNSAKTCILPIEKRLKVRYNEMYNRGNWVEVCPKTDTNRTKREEMLYAKEKKLTAV